MKWRKFEEKKPKNNSNLLLRSKLGWSYPHPTNGDGLFSYSSDTLWMNGRYALDQNYYEWLDESDNCCNECGKPK